MFSRQTLLFICSGNFYRSRFAEAVFNHEARKAELEWEALSRGFKPHLAESDLSHYTVSALEERGIPVELTAPKPEKLCENDLMDASLVVALNEPEHRPMFLKSFPFWTDRVEFWRIRDVDEEPASLALPKIEARVQGLVELLASGHAMVNRDNLLFEV